MATARKLPSGSWRCRVFDGLTADGKKKYRSFTAPTKKQAELAAAKYASARKVKPGAVDCTLAEAYAKCIESKCHTLSPTTVREYKRASHIDFPELMPLRLEQITQENVQAAVNVMAAKKSPKSVRNAHGLLSAVLRMYAPDIRLNTRLPQPKRPEIYVPSEAEIEQLIRSIKASKAELLKAILLAAFGSLRRSEACALEESDIDRENGIIHVRRALVLDDDHKWVIKGPKSRAGYRDIKLPAFVLEQLQPAEGTKRIVKIAPVTVTDDFSDALKAAGLPHFRFHDLRHYQASILHAMGVPDKYIMERGGWRTDSTLKNIYQHTMDDKRREVEDDIIRRFEQTHRKYDTQDDTKP